MTAGVIGGQSFRSDIEGLRAIAILLVLLYHAGVPGFDGGFIGVDIFFVLSGFLITTSLLREVEASDRLGLAGFYSRRVRRLLPASALALVATTIGVWVGLPSSMWRTFGLDIVSSAGYVVNWRLAARSVDYLAQDVAPSPVQHFWSLAIEEQFYLVWPALIVLALWLAVRSRLQRSTVIALVLGLVVLVPTFVAAIVHPSPASAFFVTWTRLWEMAFGALAAVVAKRVVVSGGAWVVAKVAALAGIGVSAVWAGEWMPWPGWWTLVPIVSTSVLVVAGATEGDLVHRALSVRPMQRIGAWSYSLYLWHWPPLAILSIRRDGLTVTEALAVTLVASVVAVAAFRWVENPVRFHPTLRASNALTLTMGAALTLVGVTAGLVLVAATPTTVTADGGIEGAAAVDRFESADDVLEALAATTWFVPAPAVAADDRPTINDGCHTNQLDSEPVVCDHGDPDGEFVVLLVGDSKIGQWTPAFDAIGADLGWRIRTLTKSACAFTSAIRDLNDEPYTSCIEWNRSAVDLIVSDPPDVVIVSQGSDTARAEMDGPMTREAMEAGMYEWYDRIEAAGSQLIVMLDNPHPGRIMRDCVADESDLTACVTWLKDVEDSGGRAIQRQAVEKRGYELLDVTDLICPQGVCSPIVGNVLIYRDGSHVSVTYIETMVPALRERLIDVVDAP